MPPFFALAPWEYPGAKFDPTPHAITRADIGGREREIWLKMRAGVIYFKDAQHARVYAVTRLFDDAIAEDAERLVAVWKEEVGRENYGAFVVIRRKFPRSFATGSFCLILRADGSGWVKEHFDKTWQKFLPLLSEPVLFWRRESLGKIGATVVQKMQTQFLERTVKPTHFQTIPPQWTGSGADKMMQVLQGAAQLFLTQFSSHLWWPSPLDWRYQSHSDFFNGGMKSLSSSYPYSIWSNHFSQTRELVKWRNVFIGIEWKQASVDDEFAAQLKPNVRKSWARGLNQWGENWRGNWAGRQHRIDFGIPSFSTPSQHDKLEAAFVLRDFLTDKLPAAHIETMLRDALQR